MYVASLLVALLLTAMHARSANGEAAWGPLVRAAVDGVGST